MFQVFKGVAAALVAVGVTVSALPRSADAHTPRDAVAVVSALYAAHAALLSGEGMPLYLTPQLAGRFFDPSVMSRLAQAEIEFDFLYDAQDFDIANLRVVPDPDVPVTDGTFHVVVTFTNFGEPQRLLYVLRADNPLGELAVTDIVGPNWTLDGILPE
ncbi:hypothetical protein [Acuticoccus kandeliae]|uniref:hypothetical protein n=1 Tax=Acuticoccus kandeliae TaxID=2073160 RepID=UPI000D3EBFD7|nr:hypothetical protein [Acuticoccus kandeliae]